MNLKKTVLSLFGALAIIGSMVAPTLAQPEEQDIYGSTNEVGQTTDAWLWYDSLTFPTIDVQAGSGGSSTVDGTLSIEDFRADSSGWTVSLQASDLHGTTKTGAFIEASQVTVVRRTNASLAGHSGCALAASSSTVVNPSNAFYSLAFVPTAAVPVALDANVVVMQGDVADGASRACGRTSGHPRFELTIIGGQQIDTYEGTITVTTTWGDPQ